MLKLDVKIKFAFVSNGTGLTNQKVAMMSVMINKVTCPILET